MNAKSPPDLRSKYVNGRKKFWVQLIEAARLVLPRVAPPGPIIVKSSAGLGNRIYGALNAIAYAAKYDRPISIDWADGMYGDLGENVFPLIYDLQGVRDLSVRPDLFNPFPEFWIGRTTEFQNQVDAGVSWHDWPQLAANIDDWHLLGETACDGYVYVSRSTYQRKVAFLMGLPLSAKTVFRRHLRFSKFANDAIRQHATATDSSWVGVHYRSTDLRTELSVAQVAALIKQTNCRAVYWASDNPATVHEAQSLLPRHTIASTPLADTLPLGHEPLHLSLGPAHRRAHLVGALADLHALSQCGTVIRKRNSTFSGFAIRVMADRRPVERLID